VDARIGSTGEDAKIMQKMGSIIGASNSEIIPNTDQIRCQSASSKKNPGEVSESIRDTYTPIVVVTSAELGLEEMRSGRFRLAANNKIIELRCKHTK
jgi:hypothetical protein